ncbi:MAG: family 2 glycosyl transferase [Gammaproteobacteria bacterium SG8_11]|nr:MAG: family 2 glycosyl transferase [Gammaproteobacteria bacterium SG8_11]
MPQISIITAVHNGEKTLRKCFDRIKNQSIDLEHIVIDGASTDSTLEIIHDYEDYIARCISEPDSGIYDAMNKGVKIATGDIIGILNADDFYPSSNILQKVVKVFDDNNVDACYGDLVYVDSDDNSKVIRYWKSQEYNPQRFYWGWMPPHPTFFVRRSVYEKYGMFRLDLGTAADYEIMLRFLLKHKIKAKYIPNVLVHMRTGGASNVTFGNRIKANRMDRRAWQVNGLKPYPWTLWMKPLRKVGQWFVNKNEVASLAIRNDGV